MVTARPVTAGASGMRGTTVVAVSSADRPSRAPMTAAARTLSQRELTSGPRTSRSLHSSSSRVCLERACAARNGLMQVRQQ